MEAFDKAVNEGPANPAHCMGFLHLLAEFPENVTPYYAEEVGSAAMVIVWTHAHISRSSRITERESDWPRVRKIGTADLG